MNIWVIGRGYPSWGGINGSFELEQAKMLAKRGHKVIYLALVFHPYKKIKHWGYETWEEDGLNICVYSQIYMPVRMHFRMEGFQKKKWKILLEKIELEYGIPDIIHVHYPSMITIPDIILEYKKYGTRVFATEHWSRVLEKKMDTYEKQHLRKYINEADRIMCVGEPLRQAMLEMTKTDKMITVLPNVVPDMFGTAKKTETDTFVFIAIGRLVPVKQFDKIITAFSECVRINKKQKLIIVGGGSEFRNLKKKIKELGLEDKVELTGALSRENVAKKLSEANVLICYSRLETFGVTVIEAWASGIPVIASDSLGFLEYWEDNLGCIVSHKNTKMLSEKMLEMMREYKKYDSESIIQFAKEHFSEEVIYRRLLEIYQGGQ